MKFTGLLSRSTPAPPGVVGTARVDRRIRDVVRRVGPGDIAVIDHVDLDRASADALVKAGVAAVVNAAPSISGRYPNLGPEVLLKAEIPLIDHAGGDLLHRVRDGSKVRVHEASVYSGRREVAKGIVQTAESVADQIVEARAGMSAQLEAFSANTIEFLRRERSLILDGVGVPKLRVPLDDRHVVVVASGVGHAEDLRALRTYIRHHRPVLVGVEGAADTMKQLGFVPDIVVGDPSVVEAATVRAASEVVVPAQPDGHAPGVERVQDLGIGAVTFPASANPEDLALLLADTHGAALVVTVGFQATLREFLDSGRSGSNPSTFLTRLKLGTKVVDGRAVATLHRHRVPVLALVLLVLGALAVVVVALLLSGTASAYVDEAAKLWDSVAGWVTGWFS
ncbi:thiamine pyrophosphokinase [Saccharomonospora piscinae]|uniref:Thiamine pyrophosphokinase n=1 Tax=Saccharomonospora piscinae TaxID=687388 RepID=A0A1V9AAF3_SACPI|nr:putative cytokinetic ring protein SteA [Saccharomonospora piscinae]OQO94105.1 thiamine pyrophosphokinase [Saccharomonospora piscinae]TLW95283.1 thiamine pyrophosphokinase [Saccharomonospora piscinae]